MGVISSTHKARDTVDVITKALRLYSRESLAEKIRENFGGIKQKFRYIYSLTRPVEEKYREEAVVVKMVIVFGVSHVYATSL